MKTFNEFVATKMPAALGSVGTGTDNGVGSMQASNNVFADTGVEKEDIAKIRSVLKNPISILKNKGLRVKHLPLVTKIITDLLSDTDVDKDLHAGTQAQPTQAQAPTQSPGG